MDKQEQLNYLAHKKELVESDTWKEIRRIQLEEIVRKSNGVAEENMPRLIGMLQRIYDTDYWVKEYDYYISAEKIKRS